METLSDSSCRWLITNLTLTWLAKHHRLNGCRSYCVTVGSHLLHCSHPEADALLANRNYPGVSDFFSSGDSRFRKTICYVNDFAKTKLVLAFFQENPVEKRNPDGILGLFGSCQDVNVCFLINRLMI